jgi:hypothetical protein
MTFQSVAIPLWTGVAFWLGYAVGSALGKAGNDHLREQVRALKERLELERDRGRT